MIVDNACMQLVSRPHQFEMLATGNLYGDLLSDLGAGLSGGIASTAGVLHADGIRIYESIFGASREAVGEDRANPLPLILPAVEMLKDVGEAGAAGRIMRAVETVLTERKVLTLDLGGGAGTAAFTDALIGAVGKPTAVRPWALAHLHPPLVHRRVHVAQRHVMLAGHAGAVLVLGRDHF